MSNQNNKYQVGDILQHRETTEMRVIHLIGDGRYHFCQFWEQTGGYLHYNPMSNNVTFVEVEKRYKKVGEMKNKIEFIQDVLKVMDIYSQALINSTGSLLRYRDECKSCLEPRD